MTTINDSEETPMSTQRVSPPTWRGALSRCLLLGLLVAGIVGVSVPHAFAGSYAVEECYVGHSSAAPDAVSYTTSTLAYVPQNGCSNDDIGLQVTQQGNVSSAAAAGWTLTAPAGTYFRDVDFSYRLLNYNPGPGSATIFLLPPGGTWTSPSDFTWQPAVTQPGHFTTLQAAVQCSPPQGQQCATQSAIRQLHFDLVDTANPQGAAAGGSLLSSGPRSGTETLTVHGSDQGGGVRAASVRVNGLEVARQTGSCNTVNGIGTSFHPCPSSADFNFSIDTRNPAWEQNGANSLQVCVDDLAMDGGPNVACSAPVNVVVDNSCADSAGAAPVGGMTAGLEPKAGQLSDSATVKSTEGVPIKGKVSGPSGGVAGASVCIYEQIDVEGAPKNLAQVAKTGTNGDFKANLDAGPSRNLTAVYRSNNTTITKPLHLAAEAIPVLKIRKRHLRNGDNMRFYGSIPTPYAQQRAVTMQAKVGKQWRTFKQLKTDNDGRFKGRYKFKHSTLAIAKYSFRVLVKQQDGYPFAPGSSNKQKVIVRG